MINFTQNLKLKGVLARAGFDFETSKKIMDLDSSEYSKIINLL